MAAEPDKAKGAVLQSAGRCLKSIRDFGVLPTNTAALNRDNLQKAIDLNSDNSSEGIVSDTSWGEHCQVAST